MTGEGSGDGLKLSGKECDNEKSTGKKKKKSIHIQEDDGHGKESSSKKKSSLSKDDDLDKTSVHKKKSKEAKSSDMDKSAHHKKKKKDKEKDDATHLELDKSTHKKKKSKEEESIDKASTHKHKTKTKDDLDKSSKHTHRHSRSESPEKTKSASLDKASSHQKKSKESESLDKSSRHKKKTKDMDKSSHKKIKYKSKTSLDESSTHDLPEEALSSASKPTNAAPDAEKVEKDEKDTMVTKATHKREKKSEKDGNDELAASSTHKGGKKSEKDGKDALATKSTHKRGKKSEKEGNDALGTDSKHKRGKKSEKEGKDSLSATSTHRRGKKSETLKAIDEESSDMDQSSGKLIDHHRRGKKKDILRETGVDKHDSKDTKAVGAASSSKHIDDEVKDEKAGKEDVAMDTTTGAQKVRFPAMDDASDTSDDDSSMASFGEEGVEDFAPLPRIAGSDAQVNKQGTRGPPGVFLSRQNSKNLGRILSIQASEDDIFAALEAEADRLKDEVSNPKLVTRGLARSKSSSNSNRASSFGKKQNSNPDQPQSSLPPKWQPGQQIKPMAAEDLRAMLNMKSPPKRTPTWRDSRWFRDDVVPDMPLALAVNALPTTGSTNDSGKLITLPNGTVKMLRADQCEDLKMYSAIRKSQVKDALRQSLNATIH